ncbi:MAG: fasciclin domain-containing protein, partial [Acholeplasmataceae bacterium]
DEVVTEDLVVYVEIGDIFQTAEATGDFTTLIDALEEAELDSTLRGEEPLTVFAPTDDAFAELLDELSDRSIRYADDEGNYIDHEDQYIIPNALQDVDYVDVLDGEDVVETATTDLSYTVRATVEVGEYPNAQGWHGVGLVVRGIYGDHLRVRVFNDGRLLVQELTEGVDEGTFYENVGAPTPGTVYEIEALSTPTTLSVWVNGDLIVEDHAVNHDMVPNIGPYYINNDAQFSGFEMIMEDTLVIDDENVENMSLLEWPEEGEVIEGNTNPSFEGRVVVDAYTAEDLLANPELSDILQFHVVEGLITSEDILGDAPLELTTVLGETLSIEVSDDTVYVNGIEVILADFEATNGIIHVIDGVLLP